MNVTSINCFEEKEPLIIAMIPTPLMTRMDSLLIHYMKGEFKNGSIVPAEDAVERAMPKFVFEATFKPWPGTTDLYYKQQEPYAAVKMDLDFVVDDILEGGEVKGRSGDFLVTRSSGINTVVPAKDMKAQFVPYNRLSSHLESLITTKETELNY